MGVKRGWYLLPMSGRRFYGPIPTGAVEVAAPEAPMASDDSGAAAPQRPAKSAKKAAWVDYVQDLIAGADIDEDLQAKIASATVAQLQIIADALEESDDGEQLVDPGQSSGPVGADVPGDDLSPDPDQLGPGEGDGDPSEQQIDDLGHED